MRIKRVHRITLAVNDVEAAARTFEELLGERAGQTRLVGEFQVRAVDVPLGDSVLQLVSPLLSNNPVRNFLQRKGEGVYNIAVEVDDLDGALVELAQLGVRVSEPVEAEPGVRSAFVTMSATHGLSLQLVEVERGRGEPLVEPVTREEESRAEHLAPQDEAPVDAPESGEEEAPKVLDLSVDEWSDTD